MFDFHDKKILKENENYSHNEEYSGRSEKVWKQRKERLRNKFSIELTDWFHDRNKNERRNNH